MASKRRKSALSPPPLPRVDVPAPDSTEEDAIAADPMAQHFKSDVPDAGGAAEKIEALSRGALLQSLGDKHRRAAEEAKERP